MASKKREASPALVEALLKARMDRFDDWFAFAASELGAHGAKEEAAQTAARLIWHAAEVYSDAVRSGAKPHRISQPATINELARAATALSAAAKALLELGSESRKLLGWEAQRTAINGLLGGAESKRPQHPHAQEVLLRLYNHSPLEEIQTILGTTQVRPYAVSVAGDLEILASVAKDAARLYRTPKGRRPSPGSPFLSSCILAWRNATDSFPVKTRDTDDAKNSPKIAVLYKIMERALDAIEPNLTTRPGLSPSSFYTAICDAEAAESEGELGLLLPGPSLQRKETRRASRRVPGRRKVSKSDGQR